MNTIQDLIKRLHEFKVEFVVIGGVAAVLHGSAHVTVDLDVCSPLDEQNLQRIIDALRGLNPRFRMHPSKPPLYEDVKQLIGFFNLNLDTDWGILDILGEVTGVGFYADVAKHTVETSLAGFNIRILDLPALIQAKHAAHRLKDLRMIPELEFLMEQRKPRSDEAK